MIPSWLPKLVLLNAHDGDWDEYLEALHTAFKKDFVSSTTTFQGKRIALKRHPMEKNKEATFWHFISTGRSEADRLIDLRRCERIGWPRAILDNCADSSLKIWTEEIRGDSRTHLWCEPAEYLLVLSERPNYVLPWTAYPVEHSHQKKKLLARWERNNK